VKTGDLLRHLKRHGCCLKRQGRAHSLWSKPGYGAIEAVCRHQKISNLLAYKICQGLSVGGPVSLPSHVRRCASAQPLLPCTLCSTPRGSSVSRASPRRLSSALARQAPRRSRNTSPATVPK